jgi:pimeloyl-ACP methyl ester carboxylesterase
MSEDLSSPTRRGFLRTSAAGAVTLAAAQLATIGSADAQPGKTKRADLPKIERGTNTSFASLKQIEAGVLNVGYAEAGPSNGPPVILLHGWPYDIHCYADVAPLLASAGYRVIVPYLRGYGTTRFLASSTFRGGQPLATATDIVALMDALGIEKATLAGYDWGARTANIVAALWPERVKAMVSVSGYLIGSQEAGKMPLPPQAELQWWYQFYFATERGRAGYDKYRRDFAKLIWHTASPQWTFDDEENMKHIYCAPQLADGRLYVGEGYHQDDNCKVYCIVLRKEPMVVSTERNPLLHRLNFTLRADEIHPEKCP